MLESRKSLITRISLGNQTISDKILSNESNNKKLQSSNYSRKRMIWIKSPSICLVVTSFGVS
jgi:hypothetical protein